MGGWMKGHRGLCRLLPLGAAAAALFAFGASAGAESEIDAFQRAVSTQNKQDALAFIDAFGSSHLVPDLIELLRPEVAADLCADLLPPSPRVRAACDRAEKAAASPVAVAPTALSSPKTVAPISPTKGSGGPTTAVAMPSAADAAKQTASVKATRAASQAKVSGSSPLAEPVPVPPVAATVKTAPTPSEVRQLQSPAFAMLPTATFAVVGDPPRSLPPAADSVRSY